MHTEIFNNIDLLVEMAGSELNVDDINAELISLNKEIQDKKQRLEDLKGIMNDARYFNASSELVDKNIEVSLKSKLTRLNRKIKDIELKLGEVKKEESKLQIELDSLKNKIDENKKYIAAIDSKAKNSDSSYFQKILTSENHHVKELEEELERKNERYENIKKELELNEQALKELTESKENNEARLKDVVQNLSNPNAYIDEDLKKQDEERLRSLNDSLDELQKRKLEYLTDPNMIGADAKELVINEDYTAALNKIRELLTIVKSRPYMDITNLNILDEELEKKEMQRAELSNLIDSKDYSGMNSDAIHKRTNYLNGEIEKEKNEITRYQEFASSIDTDIESNLCTLIADLESEIVKITKEIEEITRLLQDSSKSRKTKASLENAIYKKEKESEVLESILEDSKKDLLFQITMSNTIDKIIQKYHQNIDEKTEEVEELNRVHLMDETSKDFIAEEEDKEKLKSINEEIRQIKNRQKFTKTPDEIYDQIEMLFANAGLKEESPSKVEEPQDEGLDSLIDDLFIEEKKEEPLIKVIDMIPAQTVQSDSVGGVSYGA